ncbi:hypothetical protein [Paludisphaera sp.]|uniref:hypothetical protein n=1 Tax=Paludisphaera sp. TaxID=2017432 RepID=UPI00301BC09F
MSARNRNVRTRDFRAMYERLPRSIRREAVEAYRLFLRDPSHPSLRLHHLDDRGRGRHRSDSYSVSVTRSYRAIYVVDGDVNVWYWIGGHADYDAFTTG